MTLSFLKKVTPLPVFGWNLAFFCLFSTVFFTFCKKEQLPSPDPDPEKFGVIFQNEWNELQLHAAAWWSDAEGKTLAFRWLRSQDTTHLNIPNWDASQPAPHLTVVRFTVQHFSSGNDTTLLVQTFTKVPNGSVFLMKSLENQLTTVLKLTFPDAQTVDTIIVPDGLTFVRPGWWNNYIGEYRCRHRGNLWLRLKVDGEYNWRYLYLNNVAAGTLSVQVPTKLLPIQTYPTPVKLPFVAGWEYKIEGILDEQQQHYLPLGDLERAPGGARPVFDTLNVFEPAPFDPVAPSSVAYKKYRLALAGLSTRGEGYFLDDIFEKLPTTVPQPDFKIQPLAFSDARTGGAACSGNLQALVLSRRRANPNSQITWESWHAPASVVSFRLPDVPYQIGDIFPDVRKYNFDGKTRARGESYRKMANFEAVLQAVFQENRRDWRGLAGYLGYEIGL